MVEGVASGMLGMTEASRRGLGGWDSSALAAASDRSAAAALASTDSPARVPFKGCRRIAATLRAIASNILTGVASLVLRARESAEA